MDVAVVSFLLTYSGSLVICIKVLYHDLSLLSEGNVFDFLKVSQRQICHIAGFFWPLFSLTRTKSTILSIYVKIRVRENQYYGTFYVLYIFGKFVFGSSISLSEYRFIEIHERYAFFIFDFKQIFVYGLVKFWEFQWVKTRSKWIKREILWNFLWCLLNSKLLPEKQIVSCYSKLFLLFFIVMSQLL